MKAHEVNVRTPLFDRMAEEERTLDRRGLRESVRRELEALFNTRSSFPAHRLPGAPLTVIDYGIPPLTNYSTRNPNDHDSLAAALRLAVETFEPRLRGVRVHVIPPAHDDIALAIVLEAQLVVDEVREPVMFQLNVDLRLGMVGVDARA
ncbi:MAG TPA: type VI secretion system baseplate subunit TssE [Thermoanaerobaculia bacterium]|nr:type VI secretion system baseplate subunit TssE [Thermoanaerobaculia bacterium]